MDQPAYRLVIRDAKGKEVGTIPGATTDVSWRPGEDSFAFVAVAGGKPRDGLYVYSMKSRRYTKLVGGDIMPPLWSSDGSYLACITRGTAPSDAAKSARNRGGRLSVFDAHKGFARALTAGTIAADAVFSPSGRRICFQDNVKDEFGDYDKRVLRVADLATGKTFDLMTSRRRLSFIWCGGDRLAVAAQDRYARPTLDLIGLDGRATRLFTSTQYGAFKPIQWAPQKSEVVFEAERYPSTQSAGEKLSVRPGHTPVKVKRSLSPRSPIGGPR